MNSSPEPVTVAEPEVVPDQDTKKRPRRQPPYHVILWNDEHHSYGYVIHMMQVLFGYPQEQGFKIAEKVDREGKAVVMTTTRERAELKRDQIHAFGKDELIDGCKGAMWSTIEPVEG